MKVVPEKGSRKHWYNYACQFSLRHILFLFLFLLFLVIINFLASTSKLSLVVDLSMKMKSDVLDVFDNLIDIDKTDSINGTFRFRSVTGEIKSKGNKDKPTKGLNIRKVTVKSTKDTSTEDDYPPEIPWYFQNHLLATNEHNSESQEVQALSQITDKHIPVSKDAQVIKEGEENSMTTTGEKNLETGISIENKTDNLTDINVIGTVFQSNDNTRKDSCDTCFQHNFNYIIDNPDVCKLTLPSKTIDILIVILTVHKNIKNRNALRETWLSPYRNNSGNVRYVFLLGEVPDPALRKQVREENDVYHDVIKEDFIDSYKNLTYKSIMGFKWASTKCSQARFVLKTDDDMFVNIRNLLNIVNKHSQRLQTAIGGSCNLKASPIRNKKSKWYASFTSYPNPHYPGFCSGTGYVTSMNVARKVYEISPSVPFFHLEDVYSALCIRKLGYSLLPIPGFNAGRPRLDPCNYKGANLVTAHRLSPVMLRMVWRRPCITRQARKIIQNNA